MDCLASAVIDQLRVVEIPEDQDSWLTLAKMAGTWKLSAKAKMHESDAKRINSDQLRAAMNIADTIQSSIRARFFPTGRDEGFDKDWNSVFVCYSGDEANIQGIALFSKKTGHLKAMVSKPENIKHPLNDLAQRVGGVGTVMIRTFAEKCIEIAKPLNLTSYKTAISFYMGLGFEPTGQAYYDAPPMRLSLDKCKAMVLERG